jgi:hypothetical protein
MPVVISIDISELDVSLTLGNAYLVDHRLNTSEYLLLTSSDIFRSSMEKKKTHTQTYVCQVAENNGDECRRKIRGDYFPIDTIRWSHRQH